ncbi:MAG: universal stress protein [Candidatus Promineifilaceae bacterium]|jgi:nucleotide-binding universal stress UspA family protein
MKTLICIREPNFAQDTIKFGALVAKLENTSIRLLTVVDEQQSVIQAEANLTEVQNMIDVTDIDLKVRKGAVIDEILNESRENGFDLVVVGAHIMAGFLDIFLRSVTEKVANQAAMSVLVVREGRPDLQRILISIGGQKLNRKLVEVGADLAAASGAGVTALHVTAPVPSMYSGLDGMDETLEEMLQTETPIAQHLRWSAQYLAEQGIDSEIKIRHGAATDEIVREAAQGDYDLVILGASDLEGAVRGLMVEKISPQIIDKAPCSVFVVKENGDGAL